MFILKQQAVYGYHAGLIVSFWTCKHKEKWKNSVKTKGPYGQALSVGGPEYSIGGLA